MSSTLFAIVKPTCIGLLGSATLTPSTIPTCLRHLNELIDVFRSHSSELPTLSPSLVSYIFFPVSSILQRNAPSVIPDQILEKVLTVLGFLSESWWWHGEMAIWEQVFKLCGSVLGGMTNKGKGRDRDDEVKAAAAQCLYTLLRSRDMDSPSALNVQQVEARLAEFQNHARSPHFVPVLGQTLSATITISETRSLSLQTTSLKVLSVLLELYSPSELFPMVLPGVISTMSKIALGSKLEKKWANGNVVAAALHIMQIAIIKAIGDDICAAEGVIHRVDDLEGLTTLVTPSVAESSDDKPDAQSKSKRSPSWLKGTTSQLHIALNTLSTLTGHPSPVALHALATFCRRIIETTAQTLPQSQPLLLASLLSISKSSFDSVSSEAHSHIAYLLSAESKLQAALLQTLMRLLGDYLSALPRLISIQDDRKVQHLAGLIEAMCILASSEAGSTVGGSPTISKGIGKILGPSGGIEKWGWSLLSVFEFSEAPLTFTRTSTEQLMLENDSDSSQLQKFPDLQLKGLGPDTLLAIDRTFRALGTAAGANCLFSVEWFIGIGKRGTDKNAVAAMWCACRLLEGVSGIDLSLDDPTNPLKLKATKRLDKLARSLARTLPELWDQQTKDIDQPFPSVDTTTHLTDTALVERRKGLHPLHENLKIMRSGPGASTEITEQPVNHRALTLRIIAVCIGVLQSRSSALFIYILYPVLHSLVSQIPFLASTAYATLQSLTISSSYASPANLLLSNFDYCLDAISRRLTRRWLDVDATHVLVLLVRLVGSDVVEKAGDVVEECFDRLDEFHGYDVLVEGLVDVLLEVTRVLKNSTAQGPKREKELVYQPHPRLQDLSSFFEWYRSRKVAHQDEEELTDYGPAPRRAWGEDKELSDSEKVEEMEKEALEKAANSADEPPPTPTQALTKQIVSRSLYFLTHGSPVIRARILTLLASAVPNLPSSSLMPAIHSAWPFILNRLGDQETFVVSAAASLVEALSTYTGEFMFRRIWDDVWPKFKILLLGLQSGEATSALIQREGSSGAGSAYTHSHRLYRALLNTMAAALADVRPHERSFWDVLVLFRRFLCRAVHPELQQCARRLYSAAKLQNEDAVWLVLTATYTQDHPVVAFLVNRNWDIVDNAHLVLGITSAS